MRRVFGASLITAALLTSVMTGASEAVVVSPRPATTTQTAASSSNNGPAHFRYGDEMTKGVYATHRFKTGAKDGVTVVNTATFYMDGKDVVGVTYTIQLCRVKNPKNGRNSGNTTQVGKIWKGNFTSDEGPFWEVPKGTYLVVIRVVDAQGGVTYLTAGDGYFHK